jgi:methyl-accepting chemotaxis protein
MQLLTLALVICSMLVLALGAALWQMSRGGERLSSFIDRELATEREVMSAYANGLQMGQALRNILLDPGNQKAYDNFTAARQLFDRALSGVHDQAAVLEGGEAAAEALVAAAARWTPLQQAVISAVRDGEQERAERTLVESETPAWREVRAQLLTQISHLGELTSRVRQDSMSALERGQQLVLGLGVLAILLGLAAAVMVTRSLLRRLGGEPVYAAGVAQRIADGDLRHRVEHAAEGSLLAAMAAMQDGLRAIIRVIRSDTAQLVGAAGALRANEERVAEASLSQSDAAQAIAAAVEQLSTSVSVIAEHAADADRLSADTEHKVGDGVAVIQDAVSSIEQISARMSLSASVVSDLGSSVDSISGIAQVIDGVAEQTNLLALNAAIEAARAGEYGRGFAVVADEVRKLAERTRQSTLEINELIDRVQSHAAQAVNTMSEGVKLADSGRASAARAGSAITAIEAGAAEVRQVVAAIDLALGEQRQASMEIARGVEQIARMSADNHDATRSSLQHAGELDELAGKLAQTVSRFHLPG